MLYLIPKNIQGFHKKNAPQFLFDFSGYKHARRLGYNLEGEIHSSVWSTKTFLYDIRELRY